MSEKKKSVEDAVIQRVEEAAAKAFKDHVATVRLNAGMFRSWRCQKPGTRIHGFDITTSPGHLFVTGDIGDIIVSRCEDMIAWAGSAISDPRYFAEKVPHDIPTREWSYDRAREWIDGEIEDAADVCGDVEDATKRVSVLGELKRDLMHGGINGNMEHHEFCVALYDSGLVDCGDWPDLDVFNRNFLWCREAVKWLLSELRKQEAKP
jgi:hypothetical protein